MAYNRPMGETPEDPSYLKAWVTSQANGRIGIATLALGIGLSFPFGMLGVGLAGLLFGTVEALTCLYIPSMGTFRARINQENKVRRRQYIAADLTREIQRRCQEDNKAGDNWAVYEHMQSRISFLEDMARNRDVPLTEADMDRMQDARLDYLGLWLASLSIDDRAKSVNQNEVERRIGELETQAAQEQTSRADRAQFDRARSDLQEILRRHTRLGARKAAVEAKLLSIPDTLEEIYHTVITAPTSGSQADRLQDAINRLHVEEDLEAALNTELGDAPLPSRIAAGAADPRRAQLAAKATQRLGPGG